MGALIVDRFEIHAHRLSFAESWIERFLDVQKLCRWLKLHLLHNATDQTIERLDVTDEKTHDSTLFETGSWLQGRLVLLDLAYFRYRRFALIDENDGHFVSRLKESANPVITEELREWRGRAIPLGGEKISDVVEELSRKYIDVEVEVEFDRREYAGTQSRDTKRFRVVVVRNEDADGYHLYITNLSREEVRPADLSTIYRCRWEVELLFRELKTQYELDEFDTTKKHIVEILLYAALLSLVVSRELLGLVIEHADDGSCSHRNAGRRPSGCTPSSSSAT